MSDICLGCVGDLPLRELLTRSAALVPCIVCGERKPGVSLELLAESVDPVIRNSYRLVEIEWPHWGDHGDSLTDLLQVELEVEYEPADELASILIDMDPADPRDGDDPFFSRERTYRRGYISSGSYYEKWAEFTHEIRHRQRFFGEAARQLLGHIVGEPGTARADELWTFEVGPGTPVEVIFRARRAGDEAKAVKIVRNPSRELGPPPPADCPAGRMNPTGIPVFYGACSKDTALAEVRPSIGRVITRTCGCVT